MSDITPKIPGRIDPIIVALFQNNGDPRTGEAEHLTARIMQWSTGLFYDAADHQFKANPIQGDIPFQETNLQGIYKAEIPTGDHFPLGSYIALTSHAETGERWLADFEVVEPGSDELAAEIAQDIESIRGRLSSIGSGIVRIVTPIVQGADIQIVQGDDYTEAAGREIVIESDIWPSLAGASVAVHGSNVNTGALILNAHPCSIVKAEAGEDGPASISFELPSALTSSFPVGRRTVAISVKATLNNEQVVTLARGFFTVQSSPDLS